MMEVLTTTNVAAALANATTAALYSEDTYESRVERSRVSRAQELRARWATYRLPVVTPLPSFADFAAAAKKRADLAIERSVCEKDLSKAVTAISRGMAARRDEETDRQAIEILAGRTDEAFEGFEDLKAQVARLTQRGKAYAKALNMQDEVVATIRSERSIDASEAMASSHRDAVSAIADAIGQLRTAFDREDACRTLVREAGYDDRLPNFAPGAVLRPGAALDELERRAREYLQ